MAEIAVIGGINIDIEGSPFGELVMRDSNPAKISLSYGGVGRNIVENIARLGGDVAMLSVIGDDQLGIMGKTQLGQLGVDISMIKTVEGQSTSMYLSILNKEGDMELAVSDMSIIEEISLEMIKANRSKLKASKVIALDGNLDEELLLGILNELEGTALFFDPVSANKATKFKDHIGRFFSIKPNRIEAEVLWGRPILTDKDVIEAGKYFTKQGVKKVFITLGEEGMFYMEEEEFGFIRPKLDGKIASATGAGDSFSAAILMGIAANYSSEMIGKLGMATASINMESKKAVNEDTNIKEVMRRINENV